MAFAARKSDRSTRAHVAKAKVDGVIRPLDYFGVGVPWHSRAGDVGRAAALGTDCFANAESARGFFTEVFGDVEQSLAARCP